MNMFHRALQMENDGFAESFMVKDRIFFMEETDSKRRWLNSTVVNIVGE